MAPRTDAVKISFARTRWLLVIILWGSLATLLGGTLAFPAWATFLGCGMLGTLALTLVVRWQLETPWKNLVQALSHRQWEQLGISTARDIAPLAYSLRHLLTSMEAHQRELEEQIAMYQSLFDGVPCLVTVQDRDLRLIRYNKIFGEQFGGKPIDHCYKVYKGRSSKCHVCPVEQTFQDGKSHTAEETGFYKDGKTAYWIVKTAPIYNKNGEITAVMEMCLDITQRKELEEKLKKSEKKYAAIFESIPVVIFEMDENYVIRNCNRKMSQLYGYCKGELIGKPFSMLFANQHDDEFIQRTEREKHIPHATHRSKDGEEIFVSIDIARSVLHDEAIILAAVMNITDRIRAEQQIIHASKMATLGEMAAGVAHELNQPLAVLKMIGGYFIRKIKNKQLPNPEELTSMAEKIIHNVDRASKIIEHMREFGRKPHLPLTPVVLNDVLLRAADFFGEQLKIRDILLRWELEPQPPPVLADPNRLEQVFINLLLNARDAIEDRCRARDCAPEDRVITLRTRSNARHAVAEVVDTGIGIPKTILARIFEPFFSTKEVGRGTGLGLSICYDIVTDYGGSIRAFSKPGHGARFVVTLPVAETSRPGHTTPLAIPPSGA